MAANFFKKLPRIKYNFNINNTIESHEMVNTAIRYILSKDANKNLGVFYKFQWLNDLRPDTFAGKYYGMNELYWLGLFSAGVYDIHNELPVDEKTVIDRAYVKYKENPEFLSYCGNASPSLDLFYEFMVLHVVEYRDADGDVVDANTPGADPVTIIDYEIEQNEARRNVSIIDNGYAAMMRAEYSSAMNKLKAEFKS